MSRSFLIQHGEKELQKGTPWGVWARTVKKEPHTELVVPRFSGCQVKSECRFRTEDTQNPYTSCLGLPGRTAAESSGQGWLVWAAGLWESQTGLSTFILVLPRRRRRRRRVRQLDLGESAWCRRTLEGLQALQAMKVDIALIFDI